MEILKVRMKLAFFGIASDCQMKVSLCFITSQGNRGKIQGRIYMTYIFQYFIV